MTYIISHHIKSYHIISYLIICFIVYYIMSYDTHYVMVSPAKLCNDIQENLKNLENMKQTASNISKLHIATLKDKF